MRVKGGKTIEQLAHDVYHGLCQVAELPNAYRASVELQVAALKETAEKAAKASAKEEKKAAPKKAAAKKESK